MYFLLLTYSLSEFPVRSAIKCWSPWQPFWNVSISNSIHRCLHCRDLKEKGFSVIFHGEIVSSTWHGLGHSSGCFIPHFPWAIIMLVGDKPWTVLLLEKLALAQYLLFSIYWDISVKKKKSGVMLVFQNQTTLKANKGDNQLHMKSKPEKKHRSRSRNQAKMCLQKEIQEGFFFWYRLF